MVDQRDLDALERAIRAEHEAGLGRDADEPDAQRDRHRRGDRAQGRRARRRRQHVRHAGQPAPAGARRGRGRALDDEVPRRALGHDRRRRDRRRPAARTSRCASSRTRSARSRARWTASSCTAGCARCTCGWRRTARTRTAVSAWLRDAPGVDDVRWPGFGGMVSFRHPEAARIAAATRAVLARRVARRRRVADRGAAGDDPPVRRGLRRPPCRRPDPAELRRRGRRGPDRGSRAGDRRAGLRSGRKLTLNSRRWRPMARGMRRLSLIAALMLLAAAAARRRVAGVRLGRGPRAGHRQRRAAARRPACVAAAAAEDAPEGRPALRRRGGPGGPRRRRGRDRGAEADARGVRHEEGRPRRGAGRRRRHPPRDRAVERDRAAAARGAGRDQADDRRRQRDRPHARICGAAATASGWTRATTARARCRSCSPRRACWTRRSTPAA